TLRRHVDDRRVDEGRDLELVIELRGCRRRPDRFVRAADLGDVAEVEDRQAVPGLRHLAAAALPHRLDVALERIEVAEGRWVEDRRPEPEIAGIEDGLVVTSIAARDETLDELGQRLDPEAAGEVVVQRAYRLAVQDPVM